MSYSVKKESGRYVFWNGLDSAIGQLIQFGLIATAALLMGGGTSAVPLTNSVADKNFFGWWLKSTATAGTIRGLYKRLFLTGGAGGESIRAYTTVEHNAPVDTVNGIHNSLSFGASAGNVTGEGQASRNTLHVPDRNLGGTVAAVKAEVWADGDASDVDNGALIRGTIAGDGTGVAALQSALKLMTLDGLGAAGAGKILQVNTAGASSHVLKITIDGVEYGLMIVAL